MNPTTLTCLNCDRDFQPKRSNAIYCSDSCKQIAYNKRKESKVNTDNLSVNNVNLDVNEDVNETPEKEYLIVNNVNLDVNEDVNEIPGKEHLIVNDQAVIVNKIDDKQGDPVNPYVYKRLSSAVKELNKQLVSWIDEMLKHNQDGFYLQDTSDLIRRIKDTLDNYEGDPAEYPHINFINKELLCFLHDILNAIVDDPDADGTLFCWPNHIDALKKMTYSLV